MFLPQPKTPFLDSLAQYREMPAVNTPVFSTGFIFVDKLFERRGLEAGMYIVAGDPGTGKSTFCLQLMDNFVRAGHFAVYCAYEGMRNIHNVMRRLSLKPGIIVVDDTVEGWAPDTDTLIKRMAQANCENYTGKPLVMCIDSIKNIGSGSIAARRNAVIELYKAAEYYNVILLIIAHATKDSIGKKNKKLEGPAEIVGQSDCTMYLVGGEVKDGVRHVSIDTNAKNRLGPSGVYPGLELSVSGFTFPGGRKLHTVEEFDAEIASILAPLQPKETA